MPQLDHSSAIGREKNAKIIRIWAEEGLDKPFGQIDQKMKKRDAALHKYANGLMESQTAGGWRTRIKKELEKRKLSTKGQKIDIPTARSIYQSAFAGKRKRPGYTTHLDSERAGPSRKLTASDPLSENCELLAKVYITRILDCLQQHKIPPQLLLSTRKIQAALMRIPQGTWQPMGAPPPPKVSKTSPNVDLTYYPVVSAGGSIVVSQIVFAGDIDDSERKEAAWQDTPHMKNHVRVLTKSGEAKQSTNKHTFKQLLDAINDYIKNQIETDFPETAGGVLVLETPSTRGSYMLKLLEEYPLIKPVFVPPNMSAHLEPLCQGFIDLFQGQVHFECDCKYLDHCIEKKPPEADHWKYIAECRRKEPVEKYAIETGIPKVLEFIGSKKIRKGWIETMMRMFPDNNNGFHRANGSHISVTNAALKPYLQQARSWSTFYNPTDSK
eukprot:gb/GECG01007958.1/.p1 GENE.gb/GECG01007958.1/~~gb/GECG01007958.1/.p1  ORF type:complete len:440 (+),score=56.71 gb/GECG01007958.1/:1-1320(+)